MTVFQVEMRWRCSACQSEILGRYKSCQTCGKPKTDEPFYSARLPTPEDAVTDPQLVALATAGADWLCQFCQNRQADGLSACAGCGASRADQRVDAQAAAGTSAGNSKISGEPAAAGSVPVSLIWGALMVAALLLVSWMTSALGPHDVEARVVSRAWNHKVSIERYLVVDGEGFADQRPAGAFDIVSQGSRHHHYDRVQNGTTRESYTERVACGQDCRTTSVTCRSNNNGFQTCSGGDRVCSTRYCSELRYRTVPRYEMVSVSDTWYGWRVWQWKPQRALEKHGAEEPPIWPGDSEIELDVGCRDGERERSARQATYEIVFEDGENQRHRYQARDLDEFRALPLGTSKLLRVGALTPTSIVQRD